MKILQIRFKNITSLRADELISISLDSPPFSDAGIFAITGPTGAGKTSILDAITLALYRQVPRLNKIKDGGKLADIVSFGAPEALAELSFENNGKVYRSSWHIRKKGKNGKALANPIEKVQLLELRGEEPITLATELTEHRLKIEEILKLDYQQFLRSVLLAQGEFSAFLDAKTKDRGELLEQITGKSIYKKIGAVVQDQINIEEDKLKQIQFRSEAIALLSEEEDNQLQIDNKNIQSRLRQTAEEILQYQQISDWYKKEQELISERTQLEEQEENIKEQDRMLDATNQQIQRHLFSQHFKDTLSQKKEFQSRLNKLKLEKSDKEQESTTSKEKTYTLKNQLKDLNESKKQSAATRDQWTVDSQKASSLQGSLTKQIDQIKETKNTLETDLQTVEQEKKTIQNHNTILNDLDDQIQESETYLKEHLAYDSINEHLAPLSDLFSRKKQIEEQLEEIEQRQNKRKQQESDTNQKCTISQKQIAATNRNLKSLYLSMKSLQQRTNNKSLETSLQEKHNLERHLENQQKGRELISRYKKGKNLLVELELEIADSQGGMEGQRKNIEMLEAAQKSAKSAYEKQGYIIESLQLLNHEVIIEARAQLKDGDPCPVCGSKKHEQQALPTKTSLSKEKSLLQQLKIQEEKLSSNLIDYKNELFKTIANSDLNKGKLKQFEDLLSDIEISFEQLNTGVLINNEQELLLNIDQNQQKLSKKVDEIQELRELLKELESTKTNIQDLEEVKNKYMGQLLSLEATLEALAEQIESEANRRVPLLTKLDTLEKNLSKLLDDIGIKAQEGESPNNYLIRLQERAKSYQVKQNQLNENIQKKEYTSKRLVELEQSYQKRQEDLTKKQVKFSLMEKDFISDKQQLQIYIQPYSSVEDKTEQLGKFFSDQESQINLAEEQFNLQHAQLQKLDGALIILNQEIKETQDKIDASKRKLNQQLVESPFVNLEEVTQAMLTQHQYSKVEQIRNELKEAAEIWKDKMQHIVLKLKEHKTEQIFQSTEQESNLRLKELQKNKEELHQRLGQIKTILQKDKELKKENEKVLQQVLDQQNIINDWKGLKALLGGNIDSFSQYAQSLTLAHLIKLANVHLCKLNSRYTLKMKTTNKDKIELNFVLDDIYYPGVEKKLSTASGGEKFLISLALALGLSDLSSQNVQIGSLFIDEGFGTLDENTLSAAIAALETLRTQGKTIGVISHVKTLKEKISTQIQVYKKNNGSSGINVVVS